MDGLAVVSLCVVSGGATAALLPVFFLLPLSVAFGDRPVLTGVLGIGTAACYLGAWIVYSKRDDHIGLPANATPIPPWTWSMRRSTTRRRAFARR